MEIRDVETLIRELAFFKGMADEHIKLLAGCASNVVFKADEVIFRQNESADSFYIIREGRVSVGIVTTAQIIRIQTLVKDDILGWSWFFPPYIWHFDAMALDTTRAIAMDARCLRRKCDEDPVLGYDLVKRFSAIAIDRLEATRLQMADMFSRPARA